jgi:hypothetical protein
MRWSGDYGFSKRLDVKPMKVPRAIGIRGEGVSPERLAGERAVPSSTHGAAFVGERGPCARGRVVTGVAAEQLTA